MLTVIVFFTGIYYRAAGDYRYPAGIYITELFYLSNT